VIEDNGEYEAASSVNYYTRRQIRILNGRCNNIWYGSKFPDAPAIFDDDASFEKLWRSEQRIFLWTQEDTVPGYVKDAGACELAKWGGKVVLTNGPKPCPDQAWPR